MKSKSTRKLGKAQEHRLHAALTTDDLLYRKFEHLDRRLHEATERFLKRPSRVVRVVGRRLDCDYCEDLQILGAYPGPEGMLVVVRLPPYSPQKPKRAKSKKAPTRESSSQDTIKPPPGFSMGAMKNNW